VGAKVRVMNGSSKKIVGIVALVIIVVAALAGYYAYTKLVPSGPSEIHLGVLAPITGSSAANGKHMMDGATLAVNEINAAGGIMGKKVVLYFEDHAMSPDMGLAGAKKLIYDDKVSAIIGVYLTGVALAISPLLAQNKVIFISTLTSSVDITNQVLKDYNQYKYIFRDAGNTTTYALGAMEFIKLVIPATGNKTWVMIGEDLKWTQDIMDVLVPMAAKQGYTFLGPQYRVPLDTTDFSATIAKMKAQNPGAVVHFSGTTNAVVFAKQWKADPIARKIPLSSYTGMMASLDSARAVEQTAPGAIEYTYGYNNAWPSPSIPASMTYADKFEKTFNYPPDAIDMKTYEAVYIWKAAVDKTQSLDADVLVPALEQTDYQGITGRIRFDKSHDPVWGPGYWTGVLVQWQKGGKANIVWPPNMKTADPVLNLP
jgi:branched-chain amino acid transport system substrate-binding protein